MAEVVEQLAECPSCGAPTEPELDGDLIFYPCECGYYFGYARLPAEADVCAAGFRVDELAAAAAQTAGGPVFLGASIGRRPQ